MVNSVPATKLAQYKNNPETMKRDAHYPIYVLGYRAGEMFAMNQAITYLEHMILHADDRPDRGTPKYQAILEVTRDLAASLRNDIEAQTKNLTNGQ